MRKLISLLLIFTFAPESAAGQKKPRVKSDEEAPRAATAQHRAEESQRRVQAVDILKGIVEGAGEIRETQTRLAVLTGALDLLWKHDEAYARSHFIKYAGVLSDRFASNTSDRRERSEIRASMAVLLRAFARHDSRGAERLLDKFEKLLEEVLKGNSVSPGERLSLAQAGLESDPTQSAALAAKVLETAVPGSFPSYLNELEQRDAAAAASLFRTALSILSGGHVYNPTHATVLSSYVFRESYLSVPMATGGSGGAPLDFGTFATPLSPPSTDLNRMLVGAYFTAAASYLNGELTRMGHRGDPDPIHVALCFFLVKKLRGYADRLGLDGRQHWAVLDAKYSILAEHAKLSGTARNGLATVAQRIVTENTVFRFDSGDAAFSAAEKATDPVERAELLATGIRQLIDDGKYAEAVQRIEDVHDEKFREQLTTYRSFRMAEAALRNLDWYTFNAQVNRVSDARLRTYLVLSAARAASDAKKEDTCTEFLVAAISLSGKIEDADARAAALVSTAGIIYALDASWGAQILTEGVKAINRADGYDGRMYGVTLEAPKYKVWLPLSGLDLIQLFEQAGNRDWPGSVAAAQGIESKALRAKAYIGACRRILQQQTE
jgi:hypothetical protein